ncbi:mechanosensitive ion channel domain-containing protein, partial [Micromonospora sp. b486]|uniref:mechanosensitive ion channel family protein n=1 Tax=Micromonospora sp. b486 TaxID=3053986 RepID=UPI00259D1683
RYYLRKAVHYLTAVALLFALALLWRPFAGRVAVVFGLLAAGLALAMQEVIGAFAGWISILTGRQFRVGDRIQMCGVRGDVLDITPLRTRILESGSSSDPESWIRGRQYTGRVVSLSNRFVFTAPVFNSSTVLDHLWEELTLPVPYEADWHLAERILCEEAESISSTVEARRAIEQMRRRYPVADAEVDPASSSAPPPTGSSCPPGSWCRYAPPARSRIRSPGGCWTASPTVASGWRR